MTLLIVGICLLVIDLGLGSPVLTRLYAVTFSRRSSDTVPTGSSGPTIPLLPSELPPTPMEETP